MEFDHFPRIEDWTDAYSNKKYCANADQIIASWPERSNAFRKTRRPSSDLDIFYAQKAKERWHKNWGDITPDRLCCDIFYPPTDQTSPKGLFIFVHGGYWQAFDRSDFSFLAKGLTALGWIVALPSYPLAPKVSLPIMAQTLATATDFLARCYPDLPMTLCGHSAGGHLVTRLGSAPSLLSASIRRKVAHIISISGLHDLRPLIGADLNHSVGITPKLARQESPALLKPFAGAGSWRLTTWVGADERPEFIRQSALLSNIWAGLGVETTLIKAPNRDHFIVIEDLCDSESDLCHWISGKSDLLAKNTPI